MDNHQIEVEIKISFLEQWVENLKQQVADQQKQIDQLLGFQKKIKAKLNSEENDGSILNPSEEAPPPHY